MTGIRSNNEVGSPLMYIRSKHSKQKKESKGTFYSMHMLSLVYPWLFYAIICCPTHQSFAIKVSASNTKYISKLYTTQYQMLVCDILRRPFPLSKLANIFPLQINHTARWLASDLMQDCQSLYSSSSIWHHVRLCHKHKTCLLCIKCCTLPIWPETTESFLQKNILLCL